MQIYNFPNMIPAGTVMNATINSLAMQIQMQLMFAIQIVFTGTPTGSFKLQGSCDPASVQVSNAQIPYNVTNWTDIPSSSQNVSAAGSVIFNESFQAYNFVRVVYTDTSGGTSTATVTVSTFNAKS